MQKLKTRPQGHAYPRYAVRPFHAPWWLRGRHAQTLGGKLFRREPDVPLRRERVQTPDGDFLDLDFVAGLSDAAPIALVLHGLEGSARRRYMLLSYDALARCGVRAVGLNFRSCGGEANRLPRFYHSGDTADLRFVLDLLAERWPRSPRGAVGFSLGGNALLKLLGEEGDDARRRLRAAVAISVPFDLDAGGRALERWPMGRLYTWYFIRMLRRKARAKAALLEGRCDLARTLRARTLRQFDDAATAPLHGFADAGDYYAQSSSGGFVGRIRVPTLLLHSTDDPFLPSHRIPWDAVANNSAITAAFTERGGHVGFIGGRLPWAAEYWAENEAARFLAAHLLPA